MIKVSESAQNYIKKLLLDQKKGTQIKIFVLNPGKYNAECKISYYYPEGTKNDNDIKIECGKITIYTDKISSPYLREAEIDYIKDEIGYQLTLKAPNVKAVEPKKNDPLIERIDYLLKSKINPQLENHGGAVSIVKITNDMIAVLNFSGSCNGCSMINLTLKEYIEKELLSNFPELNGIEDATLHHYGEHSYL